MPFEFAILDFIQNNMTNSVLDEIMVFFTTLGNAGVIWITTSLAMIISKKYRKTGVKIALALIFSLIICNFLIKPFAARIRPFDIRNVKLLIPPPSDFSFPSGHTAAAFAAAITILKSERKSVISICAVILAVLIAFSRLYLYVHFPTDVIAGVILGVIFAFASCKIIDKIQKH